MNAVRVRVWPAAVTSAVALDVLAHSLGKPAARAAVRFGGVAALLGIARAAGVSWAELGLGRGELRSGLRTGVVAGGCAVVVVFAGVARSSPGCGCVLAACWPRCWRMRRSMTRR